MNRRSFLTYSATGAIAAAAGLGAARIAPASGRSLTLHGFMPDDPRMLARAVRGFLACLPAEADDLALHIDAPASLQAAIRRALVGTRAQGSDRDHGLVRSLAASHALGLHGALTIAVAAAGAGAALPADILLVRGEGIARPESGYPQALTELRADIHGRPAAWLLTIAHDGRGIIDRMLAGTPVAIVEDERGVVDRIRMDGRTRAIDLHGPTGRSTLEISSAGVRMSHASCRHGLCTARGVIAIPGDVLACAPNRVVVRIEEV